MYLNKLNNLGLIVVGLWRTEFLKKKVCQSIIASLWSFYLRYIIIRPDKKIIINNNNKFNLYSAIS